MAHSSGVAYRFSDVAAEPIRRMPPLRGFEDLPLVSLQEATHPLIKHVPEIEHMVDIVQGNDVQPADGLTAGESSSIALYTMEWNPRKNSFYIILNDILRNANREELLPDWLLFLRLFLTALSKLPSTGTRTVYRGVKLHLASKYRQGAKIVWWGFSSCTITVGVLENDAFFGKSGTRTLFAIECNTGKDIRKHSFYQKEDEILLIPGREFEVFSLVDMGNQLTMIQLREVEPRFPNIASIPVSSTPTGAASASAATVAKTPSTTNAISSVVPKDKSKPKPVIQPVKVSYEKRILLIKTSNV